MTNEEEIKKIKKMSMKQRKNRKWIPVNNREALLKSRYKMLEEEYEKLFLYQQGKCAICLLPEKSKLHGKIKNLSVDHDHETDQIRGLLCSCCNALLGQTNDNQFILIQALKYLISNGGRKNFNPGGNQ